MITHTTPVSDEWDVLATLWPEPSGRVIELGCGAARMARQMLSRWPALTYLGLEVDQRQHALNVTEPAASMRFALGAAQAIPADDATFDLALMLKSLHHVPLPEMDRALREVARVLKPGAYFYVSEPVYEGALNDIVRLYNDEGTVRAAAQAALDRSLAGREGLWTELAQRHFEMPVQYRDFTQFEQRMMYPTFADHQIDEAMRARVAQAYAPHQGPQGAFFTRPMHVRWWQRTHRSLQP